MSETLGMLSERAQKVAREEEFLWDYFYKCLENLYDKDRNPKGYIDMGTSVNGLCEDLLTAKIQTPEVSHYNRKLQHYMDYSGTPNLKEAVAAFLNENFKASHPLNTENIMILNGVTATFDAIGFCLGEPGDVMLLAVPVYSRIFTDCSVKTGVQVVPIILSAEPTDGDSGSFCLTATKVEAAILQQQALGKRVRGLILVNPNNPLGDVLTPDVIWGILEVCKKYQIHVVADEIYGLSVFDSNVRFHSVLEFTDLPDPIRTHVLWGMSKDFGLAGFRLGVICTRHPELLKTLTAIGCYYTVPNLVQEMAARMLTDKAWINNVYLPTNRQRMHDTYHRVRQHLESLGVKVRRGSAGFYVWGDFTSFMDSSSKEQEIGLFKKFFNAGVFVVPGTELLCVEPGWFRLIYSVPPDCLEEALARIDSVLKKHQRTD